MDRFIQFLKDRITDKTPLEEVVDIFQEMCSIPLKEDLILFETGTFPDFFEDPNFESEPAFQISLVRQCPNDEEEFYQIHVNILYKPTSENETFSEEVWSDEWDDDEREKIFDYIRNSESFTYAKDKEYIKVEIYLDET